MMDQLEFENPWEKDSQSHGPNDKHVVNEDDPTALDTRFHGDDETREPQIIMATVKKNPLVSTNVIEDEHRVRSSTEVARPKSVRFLDAVRVRRTYCLKCLSTGEKEVCWYSRQELLSIKRENRRIAKLMDVEAQRTTSRDDETPIWDEIHQQFRTPQPHRRSLDDKGACTRGLESMVEQEMKTRRMRRLRSIFVVLAEQEDAAAEECIQEVDGDDPMDDMARSYMEASSESRIRAHATALEDEKFARAFLIVPKQRMIPSSRSTLPRRKHEANKMIQSVLEAHHDERHLGLMMTPSKRRTASPPEQAPPMSHIKMLRRKFFAPKAA